MATWRSRQRRGFVLECVIYQENYDEHELYLALSGSGILDELLLQSVIISDGIMNSKVVKCIPVDPDRCGWVERLGHRSLQKPR